jgi:dolichyl-phosphate-mannose--protein O-mannosyl transferase
MVLDAYVYIVTLFPITSFGLIDYLFEIAFCGISLFAVAFSVYCASVCLHFVLLPYGGPGYGYLTEDMKAQLLRNNAGINGIWGRRVSGRGLLYRTLKMSWLMHSGNMQIRQFHGSQSQPHNWPLLTGMDVGFWGAGGQEVKCHGNVFSYYFALIGVVAVLIPFKRENFFTRIQFTIGWAACYFPFYLIPRTMYLYHYLIPLMLGCMSAGVALDVYLPRKWRAAVAFVVCALAAFGFWLWMPFVYGKYMHDRSVMMWNPNWDHGDAAYKRESLAEKNKSG